MQQRGADQHRPRQQGRLTLRLLTASLVALLVTTGFEALVLGMLLVAEDPVQALAASPVVLVGGLTSPLLFLATWAGARLFLAPPALAGTGRRLLSLVLSALLAVGLGGGAFALFALGILPRLAHPEAPPLERLLGVVVASVPLALHGLWLPLLGALWGVELGSLVARRWGAPPPG